MRKISLVLCVIFLAFGSFVQTAQAASLLSPVYVSPMPGAQYASAAQTIAFRFPTPITQADAASAKFTVVGEKSGRVNGSVVIAADERTLIFKPSRRFTPGESVQVAFGGAAFESQSFSFGVSARAWPYITKPITDPRTVPGQNANAPQPTSLPPPPPKYVTAPSTLPSTTFTNFSKINTGEYYFFSTFFSPNPYLMILDERGELVFYDRLNPTKQVLDFQALPDGRLSYFEGIGTNWGGNGVFRLLDSTYRPIKTITAGHGYEVDGHDIVFLPNGNTLLMIYDEIPADLSAQGGLTSTLLLDLIVQEIDKNGNVILDWHATDHVGFDETYEDRKSNPFDFVHGNSLDLHEDGSLLISLRHTSSVIKVDRNTGKILWRLGGKKSDFKTGGGAQHSYQHDASWLGNGRLMVFDNGNKYDTPTSRALELAVDEKNRTVSMAWEFRNKPDIFGAFLGDAQRLANGNTMIGWGGPRTLATEVNAKGEKQVEIVVTQFGAVNNLVYRWFKLPWKGNPVTPPVLVLKDNALYFSWNGATEVAAFRIEGIGANGKALPLVTVNRAGFETQALIEGELSKACRYRVVALSQSEKDLRTSNIVQRKGNGC